MGLIIENDVLVGVTDDFDEKELIIPESVTEIEKRAFFGCKKR